MEETVSHLNSTPCAVRPEPDDSGAGKEDTDPAMTLAAEPSARMSAAPGWKSPLGSVLGPFSLIPDFEIVSLSGPEPMGDPIGWKAFDRDIQAPHRAIATAPRHLDAVPEFIQRLARIGEVLTVLRAG